MNGCANAPSINIYFPFSLYDLLSFAYTLYQPEWFIANNGSIVAGAIAAGIYATNSEAACFYIAEHSKAEVMVVDGNKQLEKFVNTASQLPHLKALVVWGVDPIDPTVLEKFSGSSVNVYTWSDFMKIGADVEQSKVDTRIASMKPGNCCTLIYTSGTTGKPKACMISHDNITWTMKNMLDNYLSMDHTDRVVSYLPLSHIAAQMIDLHSPLALGGCVYFAAPDALKGSLTSVMKEVKPTLFFGVPRVWEKIQEKMIEIGRRNGCALKALSSWAKSAGSEHCRRMQYGNDGGAPCHYGCANAIVLSKIRMALGLDECKACFTAAAPISQETLDYFASLDIPVYEVFGASENTGPHTVCFDKAWKMGTCGRPLKGTLSKCAPGSGELCLKGRHIFMGYMYMPEKTADTFDSEGYLLTGDIGSFDEDNDPDIASGPAGFMRITGRIKELIISAGGENIPPVLIENEMKHAMEALSSCMVVGNRRKYLIMLVALKLKVDNVTGLPTDELAPDSLFFGKQIGSSATTYTEAKADPLWKKYVDEGMKQGNSQNHSAAQIVKKWVWLPTDFSEKGGDLTPTLKLKRSVVADKYADLIDATYAETAAADVTKSSI